ncbi:MAG: RluA family pseudouridine synthase [Pirellulaceae bacterium]
MLAGNVYVNSNVVRRPDQVLNPGDTVHVMPPEKKLKLVQPKFAQTPKHLKVWYEDNYILVVDKPAGLLAMPTRDVTKKTLLEAVRKYLSLDKDERVYCLQRLDRDVSGVVVFAKDEPTYESLRQQFQDNKPSRKYVAIVAGIMKDDQGTFKSYLATGKHLKRHSVKNPKQGELAITHYRVVRRLKRETVVEVELETGRRNQIRVHFSEAGHPVIGETRYSRLKAARDHWDGRRIALHANTLGFTHPATGDHVNFCSPWPVEFKQFVKADGGKPESSKASEAKLDKPKSPKSNWQSKSNKSDNAKNDRTKSHDARSNKRSDRRKSQDGKN